MNPQDDAQKSQQHFNPTHPWDKPQNKRPTGVYEDPARPVLPPVVSGAADAYSHPSAPPVSPSPMGYVPSVSQTPYDPAHPSQIASAPQPQTAPVLPISTPKTPKKRSRKRLLLVASALTVLVAALAVTAGVEGPRIARHYRLAGYHRAEAQAQKDLSSLQGASTAADVRKIDSTSAFFAVFAHAAQQRTVQTTTGYYFSTASNDYRQPDTINRVTFDYATKQFSFESDTQSLNATAGQPDQMKCVGGRLYEYDAAAPQPDWVKSTVPQACAASDVLPAGPNDGLNTGGLSAAQAQAFGDALREDGQLLKVNGVSLAQHAGKQYVRFDITVRQKQQKPGAQYLGMQYFMDAFKSTGLDPAGQPYAYLGAGAAGMRIAYYVDPTTQLPVYAELRSTDILDSHGKPQPHQTYVYSHVEYAFGGQVPTLDLNTHAPLALGWPSDTL